MNPLINGILKIKYMMKKLMITEEQLKMIIERKKHHLYNEPEDEKEDEDEKDEEEFDDDRYYEDKYGQNLDKEPKEEVNETIKKIKSEFKRYI